MKKRLWVLIVPIILVGCGRDPEPPADHFDKKVQCLDIGKSYIEGATVGFYGYVEELDTCVGATIKEYETNIEYDIYDILGRKSLYNCSYIRALAGPGQNECNGEFFNLVDSEYKLR